MADPAAIAEWDAEAAAFDEPVDHGLLDPAVRERWLGLLDAVLPAAPALVADVGCGTGTLSLLLTDAGHRVVGVDFSGAMLVRAATKTTGRVGLVRGDAFTPPLRPASYDVVLCRHVLWAMPDPAVALERWARLLRPGGRLVLIEGRWSNGAGLSAEQTMSLVAGAGLVGELTRLTDSGFWGREISDDRYLVIAAPGAPFRQVV